LIPSCFKSEEIKETRRAGLERPRDRKIEKRGKREKMF
jgi:hypothetical protein